MPCLCGIPVPTTVGFDGTPCEVVALFKFASARTPCWETEFRDGGALSSAQLILGLNHFLLGLTHLVLGISGFDREDRTASLLLTVHVA